MYQSELPPPVPQESISNCTEHAHGTHNQSRGTGCLLHVYMVISGRWRSVPAGRKSISKHPFTWSASPLSSTTFLKTASAVGERHMLPRHTNSTLVLPLPCCCAAAIATLALLGAAHCPAAVLLDLGGGRDLCGEMQRRLRDFCTKAGLPSAATQGALRLLIMADC